ncbi:MAG: hypothetical protein H6709_23730 [Kofleriaceae bacterium]|nr:hypothetical protein [Myxococcales bacterium]MCB9563869.1 hypothetical protein [Kofleriaceae bacterium]MCB9575097.1 hypothetical protein [Kofleriaceae bacterium]
MKSLPLVLALGAAVATSVVAVGTAAAQKKAKVQRACGITGLPMTVGNTWTYEPVQHPNALDDSQTRLIPLQPRKVVIEVTAVDVAKDATTVSLKETITTAEPGAKSKDPEKLVERTVDTSLTCNATSITVSPDAFWFAGDPGGAWHLDVDGVDRKGHTFEVVAGKIDGREWHDDLVMNWKRIPSEGTTAKLGAGKLELERRVVLVADDEAINTVAGAFSKSTKLGIEAHGRVSVEGSEGKPYELPEGMYSFLWFVDGVGVVMVNNAFIQAYQLTKFDVAQ